ncbi:MAG: cytochrome b/b6 domain-containing protein [Betaproteobacteria bacterium]|nr:cytochrome b/b6 domain-containing protein [Betaproteobacteria bacterium]MDH3437602.1 cytochrome b/b6 domain-containing protein [Betaproteobacteria bacterium]
MERIYVHPLPVRIWHMINAAGFVLMILTGTQIRYVGLIDILEFKTAVNWHNWIGFVLIGNYFIWLLFYLFSDKIKVYHPELSPTEHFRKSFRQMQYYGYGIFRGSPNPHQVSAYDKFNPMQSMMYQVVMMLLVPVVFFTGILLWDVTRFYGLVELFGGVRVIDTVHVLIYIFCVFFIIFHIYMGSLGHTVSAHYKAMFVTGYEEVPGEHAGEKPEGNTPAA